MSSLRERRHAETRAALVDATFDLLRSHNFATLTMEEIAEKAGISRSTAYRRFASKEDIILEVPRQWTDAWDQAQVEIDEDATLMTALSHGSLAVAQKIDENHELVLLAFSALAESPTLQSSGANSADWIERVASTILGHEPGLDQLEVRVLAGAWMGAIDAMMMTWVDSGGKSSVTELTEQLTTRLEGLLR